jgi:hypothetical protein
VVQVYERDAVNTIYCVALLTRRIQIENVVAQLGKFSGGFRANFPGTRGGSPEQILFASTREALSLAAAYQVERETAESLS